MRLVLHPKVYSDINEIMGYYERVATPGLAEEFYTIDIHLLDPGVDSSMAEPEQCRPEWSWISMRTSDGRGRDAQSVQAVGLPG